MVERIVETRARPVCSRCGFIFYQGPKLAVATVVVEDGKLLLNKRDVEPQKGLWSFPSGYVDLGEAVEDAAIRETREETGLEIHLNGLVGVYSRPERSIVLVVFAGTASGGEIVVGNETQDVRMFDLDDLPKLAFEHDQDIIRDWRSSGL
ncbi:MAG: NUDIX domain-containing protein [Chloroflexi bacterium]|nr:NUDIX domain-containing protein [Chloroflexota bacterium]